MGPYTPHEFDATPHVKPGSNSIDVGIADLTPDPAGGGQDELQLGLNQVWECYGSIIRDVYLEIRPRIHDNMRLTYDFALDYANVMCRVRLFLSSSTAEQGKVRISLEREAGVTARAERDINFQAGNSEVELSFELNSPALWSPERPSLYRLRATLGSPLGTDELSC
jgi:beta-galactosidase/beta-glucuronidase